MSHRIKRQLDRINNPTDGKYSLGFRLTTKCNKNCKNCGVRYTGKEKDFSIQLDYLQIILPIFQQTQDSLLRFVLSGGETLMYKSFRELVTKLKNDFTQVPIFVITNGKLVSMYEDLASDKLTFRISEYPGWNDEEVKKYRDKEGFKIYKWKGFRNPDETHVNRTDVRAKKIFSNCSFRNEIKYIEGRVYPCCVANNIERNSGLKTQFSIKLTKNWKEDLEDFRCWKICTKCTAVSEVKIDRSYSHD